MKRSALFAALIAAAVCRRGSSQVSWFPPDLFGAQTFSAPITLPLGSAPAPSLTFTGTASGLYNDGAVVITVDAVAALSVDNTGARAPGFGILNSTNPVAGGFEAAATGIFGWGLTPATQISQPSVGVVSFDTSAAGNGLGKIIAASLNGLTITSTTGTITLASGKNLTANNSITLAGTDSTTMTLPSTNATIARTDAAQTFSGVQTFGSAIIVPVGSAAAPGIVFAGTTNSGFYSTSNLIYVSISGTGRFLFNNGGASAPGFGIINSTNPTAGGYEASTTGVFGWGLSPATQISQPSTGVVSFDTGTAGNGLATVIMANLTLSSGAIVTGGKTCTINIATGVWTCA